MTAAPHNKPSHPLMVTTRRRLLAGLVTVIPLMVTWFIISFLFRLLSQIGRPIVDALARLTGQAWPGLSHVLTATWVVPALSVLLVVVLLYLLGVVTSMVLGRRAIEAVEALIARIPFVQTVYGSVRQLLDVLRQDTGEIQRVVLIDFPSPEMKTVGFVTRTLTDVDTGAELAAVYVPTTPNPTSGYLEIVPVEKVISTSWSFDEAMTFIVSGGAVGRDTMNFASSASEEAIRDARHRHDDG